MGDGKKKKRSEFPREALLSSCVFGETLGNRCPLTLNLIFMKIKNCCRRDVPRAALHAIDRSPGTLSSDTVFGGREELFLAAEGLQCFE